MKSLNEECDDGGTANGDGCDSNCDIEGNSSCDLSVNPSICDVCGNNK